MKSLNSRPINVNTCICPCHVYMLIRHPSLTSKSEWVIVCCLTSNEQFVSYIMARTIYIQFNEMMMSALYYTNTHDWILIVLVHWNNSSLVDMSLHSDTLTWFWANQYLLLFVKAVCLAEKQQIPIVLSLMWPIRGLNPLSIALLASTLTITPPIRFNE